MPKMPKVRTVMARMADKYLNDCEDIVTIRLSRGDTSVAKGMKK